MARSKNDPGFTEYDLQEWLDGIFSDCMESITNLGEISMKLQERLDSFHSKPTPRLIDTLGEGVSIVVVY